MNVIESKISTLLTLQYSFDSTSLEFIERWSGLPCLDTSLSPERLWFQVWELSSIVPKGDLVWENTPYLPYREEVWILLRERQSLRTFTVLWSCPYDQPVSSTRSFTNVLTGFRTFEYWSGHYRNESRDWTFSPYILNERTDFEYCNRDTLIVWKGKRRLYFCREEPTRLIEYGH